MSDEEVRKALKNGKLSLNTGDTATILTVIAISVIAIYFSISTYIRWGFPSALWTLIIGVFFISFTLWRFLWFNKQLIQYKSDLTYDEKTEIIEKLLTQPDLKPISKFWVAKRPNFYGFNYRKGVLSNYSIIALYNESGYCVSSIIGITQWAWFSPDTANEIIDKIKKLEAEL
jgi:hypothetical protein